jgi:periplasmic protein TonB
MVSRLPPRQRPESYHLHEKSGHVAGAGVTILLHAVVLAVLLQFQPVRSAISEAVPIMVSLITPPPTVEKPKELPKPLAVKPRIKRVEPQPGPPPLITAATEAPPPPTAPEPQPVAPTVAPAPVAAAPAATPPVPVVPPSFNAAYLNNPPPAYPAVARRAGQQGKVVLRVLVNASGSPDSVEIRSSSGFDRLDDAALDAVRRWRFVPARQGDTPVAAWVLVPLTFTLES